MRRERAWDKGCVARTRKAGGGKGSRMVFFGIYFFLPVEGSRMMKRHRSAELDHDIYTERIDTPLLTTDTPR